MTTAVPRVSVTGVSKTFGRSRVLRDVSLRLEAAEVHALLGQNGSGKSTLIKVLSGIHAPDHGGAVEVDGAPLALPTTPREVMAAGITVVHQTLGLVPGHSVAENIRLGVLRRRRWGMLIDWGHERRLAAQTLERLQVDLDLDAVVDTLPMGARATVAIARALQTIVPGQGCVILDESTQSLPRETLPEFYDTVRRLADAGTAVLIVSHRLEEVTAVADRVTVLRDGAVVCAGEPVRGGSHHELARRILGRELVAFEPEEHRQRGEVVELRGLRSSSLTGIDLDVRRGEILGVTGGPDSGVDDLPALLSGSTSPRHAAGTLRIGTTRQVLGRRRPRGVAVVPADRLGHGLALEESASANLSLPRLRRRPRPWLLRTAWQREEFARAAEMLDIRPREPSLPISAFSGGNQQKVLLAKWLLDEPDLLVLHEPTQAVDVGARADILRALSAAAARGVAVIICSIEAEDLSLLCDRVVVLDEGRLDREVARPLTPEALSAPVEFSEEHAPWTP